MKLTHIDEAGQAKMVNVTDKSDSHRTARASGCILMKAATIEILKRGQAQKGNVLAVAQVAAIMAAKETSRVIPMCHPLQLSGVDVSFEVSDSSILVNSTVSVCGKTGVEMEALHAVSVALLTIYDMLKAVDKDMTISDIRLDEKSGGKSGHYKRGQGVVKSLNISRQKGVIKKPVKQIELIQQYGLQGDAHAGDWHRQVSLLAVESYRYMIARANQDIPIGSFAENITTQGIALAQLTIGSKLRIGQTELQVTQIGKECHSSCEIRDKIGDCVMPTEGIFARVITGGTVSVGDQIDVIDD